MRLIVRRQLEQAARWHEKLMGLSRLEEREACLVECAAICQLGPTERRIMERPCDELEAPSEPARAATFFAACFCIAALFAACAATPEFFLLCALSSMYIRDTRAPNRSRRRDSTLLSSRSSLVAPLCVLGTYYVVKIASDIGSKKTGVLLRDVALSAALYYGFVLPLEIYFTRIWLVAVLEEHFRKYEDPTSLARFPYATRCPESAASYVVMRHKELRGTRISKYLLCEEVAVAGDRATRGVLSEVRSIWRDSQWTPSPRTRFVLLMLSGFLVLSVLLQEIAFEELFTVAPFLSAYLFQLVTRHGVPIPADVDASRKGGDASTVLVIVGVIAIVVALAVAVRAAGFVFNGAAASPGTDNMLSTTKRRDVSPNIRRAKEMTLCESLT